MKDRLSARESADRPAVPWLRQLLDRWEAASAPGEIQVRGANLIDGCELYLADILDVAEAMADWLSDFAGHDPIAASVLNRWRDLSGDQS